MTLTATRLAADSQRYSDAFTAVCTVDIVAEPVTQSTAAKPALTRDTARQSLHVGACGSENHTSAKYAIGSSC